MLETKQQKNNRYRERQRLNPDTMNKSSRENGIVEHESPSNCHTLPSENFAPDNYYLTGRNVLPSDGKAKLLPLATRELNSGGFALNEDQTTGKEEQKTSNERRQKYLISPDSGLKHSEKRSETKLKERRPECGCSLLEEDWNKGVLPSSYCAPVYHSGDTTRYYRHHEEPKVKRLSLPELFSGCTYSTCGGSIDSTIIQESPTEVLKVAYKTFDKVSNIRLMSGGIVVFSELAKHISLPNLYAQSQPLVVKDIPTHANLPEIAPIEGLLVHNPRVFARSYSGGDVEQEVSVQQRKVSLPDILQGATVGAQRFRPSARRFMSGGGVINLDCGDGHHGESVINDHDKGRPGDAESTNIYDSYRPDDDGPVGSAISNYD